MASTSGCGGNSVQHGGLPHAFDTSGGINETWARSPKHSAHDAVAGADDILTARATRQFQKDIFRVDAPDDFSAAPAARLSLSAGQSRVSVPVGKILNHPVSVSAQTSNLGSNGQVQMGTGFGSVGGMGFLMPGGMGYMGSVNIDGPFGMTHGVDLMRWHNRDVRDLGPGKETDGCDSETAKGKRRVEIRQCDTKTLSWKTSLPSLITATVRCDAQHRQDAVMRTQRDNEVVRSWLRKETKVPAGTIPSLAKCAEAMQAGDELEHTIVGTFYGSGSLGSCTVRVGAQVIVEAESRICVRKVNDNCLHVTYRPRSIKAVRGVAAQDYGAQIAAGGYNLSLHLTGFAINLPDGADAFARIIRGELPVPLPAGAADLGPAMGVNLEDRFGAIRENPAPGVRCLVLGEVQAAFKRQTALIGWRFLPAAIKAGSGICFVGYEHSKGVEQVVKTDGNSYSLARTTVRDRAGNDWWRGQMRRRVEVTQRWTAERLNGEVTTRLAGVVLRYRIMVERLHAKRVNRLFLDPFRAASGSDCGLLDENGLECTLMAVRHISHADMAHLSTHPWTAAELDALAQVGGIAAAPLHTFIKELRALAPQEPAVANSTEYRCWVGERIACLERFAQECEIGAFVVHRLLPSSTQSATVCSDIPDIKRLSGSAATLRFTYPQPITAQTPMGEVRRRFKESLVLLRRLDVLRTHIQNDPFMGHKHRTDSLAEVARAEGIIRGTLQVGRSDAAELSRTLQKKLWLSSNDQLMLTFLDSEAELATSTDVITSWSGEAGKSRQSMWQLLGNLEACLRTVRRGPALSERCLFLPPAQRQALQARYKIIGQHLETILRTIFDTPTLRAKAYNSLSWLWWTTLQGWRIAALLWLPFSRYAQR